MFKRVYGIFPVWVIYTKKEINGFIGFCYGPIIKIKESEKGDKGLLQHELTHSRQFYRTLFTYGLLNRVAKLRYKFEMEAYTVQLAVAAKEDREHLSDVFTNLLATRYGLEINRDKVKQLLLKGAS